MGKALFNQHEEKILIATSIDQNSFIRVFENPNFYGIFFFQTSKGTITIDEYEVTPKENSILFYYPYQKISIRGHIQGKLIQFHPDFFCIDIHAKDIGCQGVLFNNFFNDTLLSCTPHEFKDLFDIYLSIQKELTQLNIGQVDMVSSQLKILLIRAVRIKRKQLAELCQPREHLHSLIEILIQKHFIQETSPDFYANKLNVSLTTFNRLCHKYFGNSFVTILNLKRVAVAKTKLFLTNLAIKDIAYQLGYNDPLYFTRVFKKYTGISPKYFRTQLKSSRLI